MVDTRTVIFKSNIAALVKYLNVQYPYFTDVCIPMETHKYSSAQFNFLFIRKLPFNYYALRYFLVYYAFCFDQYKQILNCKNNIQRFDAYFKAHSIINRCPEFLALP